MTKRIKPYGDKMRKFNKQWDSTNQVGRLALCQQYGVTYRTGKTWRFDPVDEEPTDCPPVMESLIPIINVPPIKLKEYKNHHGGKADPETQVLLIGDWHLCEITPTYNVTIAKQRINTLFESTMTINEVHRRSFPIDDLVIIALGDMVHGENPHQGAKIGSVAMGASDQVYDVALPEMISLIDSFKQNFKSIKFYGVRGNHGRISKEAPATSNWDIALYKALQSSIKQDGIEICPPTDFCQIVNIRGFRFFCYHGDQINVSNGIPYFAQRRKLMSWYITYGGFAYACQGHFHEDDRLAVSAKTELFCNGPLVSDDPFPLEKLGLSTFPIQRTFGVHERFGVSWDNRVIVDYGFLPEKEKK